MKPFEFTLQRVLDYRRMVEEWAKHAYLEARIRRLEAEADLTPIFERRAAALGERPDSVDRLLTLDRYLVRLDDQERDQRALIAILIDEEEAARTSWVERRQDAEALEKLRQSQYEEWALEAEREEQRVLDEWAVLRRAA
ncbi:MAG TPA: flagellar export protein FliJ [Fimbriimonadaceae bacterium]|nr:flagellar export protein FliJ [Fimbriimonadaceae bacterium]